MLEMTCSYPLSTVVYDGKSGFSGWRLGGRLGRGWGLCECGGRHKAKRNNDEYALFFHDKKAVQAGAN